MNARRALVEHGPIAWFRTFRWTRPFWGGLLVLFAGLEIGILPLGPITEIVRLGPGGLVGFLCAAVLVALGLLIWFVPVQRVAAGVAAVAVSVATLPLTNLGGFIVGMLAGIVGGCLAFAWVPDKPRSVSRSDAA